MFDELILILIPSLSIIVLNIPKNTVYLILNKYKILISKNQKQYQKKDFLIKIGEFCLVSIHNWFDLG